jgi:hypothetical protein
VDDIIDVNFDGDIDGPVAAVNTIQDFHALCEADGYENVVNPTRQMMDSIKDCQ